MKKNANKGSNKSVHKNILTDFMFQPYFCRLSLVVLLHPDDELIAHCRFINKYEAIITK